MMVSGSVCILSTNMREGTLPGLLGRRDLEELLRCKVQGSRGRGIRRRRRDGSMVPRRDQWRGALWSSAR